MVTFSLPHETLGRAVLFLDIQTLPSFGKLFLFPIAETLKMIKFTLFKIVFGSGRSKACKGERS